MLSAPVDHMHLLHSLVSRDQHGVDLSALPQALHNAIEMYNYAIQ